MNTEELADQIRNIAKERDIPVSSVSRDLYREHSGLSGGRNWGTAKTLAERGRVDIVPEGFELDAVSTFVDGQWTKAKRSKKTNAEMLARAMRVLEDADIPTRQGSIASPAEELPEGLAVYPIGDMHLGMYARARQTNDEDWDTAKGLQIGKRAIDHLVFRGTRTKDALLLNLGDFYHVETGRSTVKGTPQDTDGSWLEMIEAGVELKRYMIDRLLQHHERVVVWNMVGNHDGSNALTLALVLRAYYANEPRVEIPVNPGTFQYLVYGKTAIGSTHGDKTAKPKDLALKMANFMPEWSETTNRYWLVGHVHHSSVKEEGGVIVETFRTLAPSDGWHSGGPWISGRDMRRIVYDKEGGEVERSTVPASMLQ